MEKKFNPLYDEFHVSVADTEFIFFADKGFGCKSPYHSENHSHKFNEIIYCLKGSIEIVCEKDTQKITAGDVLLIAEGTVHSLSADADAYCIFLSFWKNDTFAAEQNIRVFQNFPASGAFERIPEYYYSNYTYKKELIVACLHEIAAMFTEISLPENMSTKNTATLENNHYRIYMIEQYFQSEYNQKPKITELSDLLHLSVQQTQRIIASLYGQTFRERILRLRMHKAKTLLTDTDKTIEEIATAVGYSSVNRFYSVFKACNGITPKQYRTASKIV